MLTNKKIITVLSLLLLLMVFVLFSSRSFAASVYDQAITFNSNNITVEAVVRMALGKAASGLFAMAISWLGTFMLLQILLTNIGLLKSGADFEAIFAKLIGSLLWFGFCIYIINNGPDFIDSVGTEIQQKFASGIPHVTAIATTCAVTFVALITTAIITGVSVVGTNDLSLSLFLFALAFMILGIGIYFVCKVFMMQLELGLIVALSPLSFSFLGLNALKDQGIAPFKSLIALIYRMVLMGIILTAYSVLMQHMHDNNVEYSALNLVDMVRNVTSYLNLIVADLIGLMVLTFLLWKSDSIASSLASGSSNMSSADVSGAIAAGAAAGAAIVAGGSMAAGATKSGGPISKLLDNMRGKGSVSNASKTGDGGQAASPPPPLPSNSLSPGNTNAYAGPPVRSEFEPVSGSNNAQTSQAVGQVKTNKDSPSSSTATAPTPNGDATASGITGGQPSGSSKLEDNLGKLVDNLSNPKPKSFGDHLKEVNQHVSNEKATTSASISTHHE